MPRKKKTKRSVYLIPAAMMILFASLLVVVLQLLTANWATTLVVFALLSPVIVLSVAVGRGICGWVCPVGSRYKALETNKPSKNVRNFCRYVCPFGLIFSLFNKICLLQLHRDGDKCGGSMCPSDYACIKNCPMECDVLDKLFGDRNCIRCFRCVHVCEAEGLQAKWIWQ